jgi:hypothetical protein
VVLQELHCVLDAELQNILDRASSDRPFECSAEVVGAHTGNAGKARQRNIPGIGAVLEEMDDPHDALGQIAHVLMTIVSAVNREVQRQALFPSCSSEFEDLPDLLLERLQIERVSETITGASFEGLGDSVIGIRRHDEEDRHIGASLLDIIDQGKAGVLVDVAFYDRELEIILFQGRSKIGGKRAIVDLEELDAVTLAGKG